MNNKYIEVTKDLFNKLTAHQQNIQSNNELSETLVNISYINDVYKQFKHLSDYFRCEDEYNIITFDNNSLNRFICDIMENAKKEDIYLYCVEVLKDIFLNMLLSFTSESYLIKESLDTKNKILYFVDIINLHELKKLNSAVVDWYQQIIYNLLCVKSNLSNIGV